MTRHAPVRLGRGVLAALALLGAGASLLAWPSPLVEGGPREARERWREAQNAKGAPWRERAALYRAVRVEAAATDPIGARAAEAEAKALAEGGHCEAAAAAEALAAGRGAPRDPDRLGRVVTAGRERLDEGDVAAAAAYFEDVCAHGGAAAPVPTAAALVHLAKIAKESADPAALERIAARASALLPRAYDVRLEVADCVGLERLAAGDEPSARRMLTEERRLYEEGRRMGAESERAAEKVWLTIELPRRLPARRRGRDPRTRVSGGRCPGTRSPARACGRGRRRCGRRRRRAS